VPAYERRPFPLVPRQRVTGLPFGDLPGRRRGQGIDVIGDRPYQPGDPVSAIDWFASARLSTATGTDAFVVRDNALDESPRVVIVVDRRPAMGLYPEPLPWLSKRRTLRGAVEAIVVSTIAARADFGVLDFAGAEAWWLPPGRRDRAQLVLEREGDGTPFDAPDDSLGQGLTFLAGHGSDLPRSSFVFLISDFLAPPPADVWQLALARGWDLVPVVVQDPVWERSFPAVGGIAVPIAYADGRPVGLVRLSRRQAERRRNENESRYARLMAELESLALQPVALAASEPAAIDRAFLEWAEQRRRGRWTR